MNYFHRKPTVAGRKGESLATLDNVAVIPSDSDSDRSNVKQIPKTLSPFRIPSESRGSGKRRSNEPINIRHSSHGIFSSKRSLDEAAMSAQRRSRREELNNDRKQSLPSNLKLPLNAEPIAEISKSASNESQEAQNSDRVTVSEDLIVPEKHETVRTALEMFLKDKTRHDESAISDIPKINVSSYKNQDMSENKENESKSVGDPRLAHGEAKFKHSLSAAKTKNRKYLNKAGVITRHQVIVDAVAKAYENFGRHGKQNYRIKHRLQLKPTVVSELQILRENCVQRALKNTLRKSGVNHVNDLELENPQVYPYNELRKACLELCNKVSDVTTKSKRHSFLDPDYVKGGKGLGVERLSLHGERSIIPNYAKYGNAIEETHTGNIKTENDMYGGGFYRMQSTCGGTDQNAYRMFDHQTNTAYQNRQKQIDAGAENLSVYSIGKYLVVDDWKNGVSPTLDELLRINSNVLRTNCCQKSQRERDGDFKAVLESFKRRVTSEIDLAHQDYDEKYRSLMLAVKRKIPSKCCLNSDDSDSSTESLFDKEQYTRELQSEYGRYLKYSYDG